MTEIVGHKKSGTNYQESGIRDYAKARHGPDGAKFLDPVFTSHFSKLDGADVVDIGCGAGPWAVYAVDHGANAVLAIDYQMGMLEQAEAAVTNAYVDNKVQLAQADGASLPVVNNRFDLALSINVGCNLPNTSIVSDPDNGNQRAVGFNPHFTEIARVLKVGGRSVVTAPTSFGEVFTQGDRPKEMVIRSIEDALRTIGESQDAAVIKANLDTLRDVHRATFALRNNHWVLITDESELKPGEKIWRKLPGLTVPNFYHNEQEYVDAAKEAGLRVVSQQHELFATEQERVDYNDSVSAEKHLGPEYVKETRGKPPFAVFVFEKPAQENKYKI